MFISLFIVERTGGYMHASGPERPWLYCDYSGDTFYTPCLPWRYAVLIHTERLPRCSNRISGAKYSCRPTCVACITDVLVVRRVIQIHQYKQLLSGSRFEPPYLRYPQVQSHPAYIGLHGKKLRISYAIMNHKTQQFVTRNPRQQTPTYKSRHPTEHHTQQTTQPCTQSTAQHSGSSGSSSTHRNMNTAQQ